MRKITTKLMVRYETIRTLANHELAGAVGGGQANCTALTFQASSCPIPPAAVESLASPNK